MKIYVSNLLEGVTEGDLGRVFASFGQVLAVELIQKRGSATVEMPDEVRALRAAEALRGKNLKGKPMRIARLKGLSGNQGPRRSANDRKGGPRR
jgi:RNA recognition motif-containing protein